RSAPRARARRSWSSTRFSSKPTSANPARANAPGAFDPDALFEAAGLRLADFQEAPASRAPVGAGDRVLAWTGRASSQPADPVRVDAVAWQGRPVSFLVRDGATALDTAPASDPSGRTPSFMLRTVRPVIFLFALPARPIRARKVLLDDHRRAPLELGIILRR